ncbi:ribonuclease Y [Candidatus Uhrbacteria bacterium RIFCSPHIGHO2_12_FULL_57_11]|uniref:Ribonuclease Y n=2 Tax=Candidatus Uhriibacteriota TaxID=1752732 RepID=A0A1F7UMQ7_9BACT|nr:MAG: ribonuclease Y [Candidatus Uhrbacteria bacterium RIFCSPHIGHO2_02_FULL_57_19]OGL79573.1 MAG: ribonuclease Y [Candidatus Uhrbacteria bacterium RIFCSPHIGHO2_12_FULL_57_11]
MLRIIMLAGAAAIGCGAGIAIGYLIRQTLAKNKVDSAEAKAEKILADAKIRERDFLIQAKEKGIRIVEEAKREETARRQETQESQKRVEKREALFDTKLLDLQDKQTKALEKAKEVEVKLAEIQEIKDQQMKKLETVASLSIEEAKAELFRLTEETAKEELTNRLRKVGDENSEEYQREAKKILGTVISRMASSHSAETTTTSVSLPSDDMKGRIIGKEGRNIKAIENLTGTEIIVDETPNVITISGFSPIRRQIAKRALDKLLSDGRIHPGRIEEAVEESKKELSLEIIKAGDEAMYQLGVTGLDPKLVQILGRLKFRTSYGQNVLLHSMEVGNLAGLIASEIGANVAVCKKGGLLHDIGKAVDHDVQGAHPEIGYNIMKKFGLPEEVAYMSIAHHEDKPKNLEGCVVKAADAISGARPGARKDTLEQYVKRLEELEGVATSFPGVEKAYAIQAGRELRVFVTPKAVDDFAAYRMARDIANRIEGELHYPGEIKVTLIRETRVIEYAR